jgi:phage recombination protein Bet
MNAVATLPTRSVLVDMSARYGMEPAPFEATLRATVCKGNVSREEFAAFLLVAKEYRLNPLTKEIYAFPAKGGGIQPIVSIDGWARIINEHPAFDGMEFEDIREGEKLIAITCRMFRKDRSRTVEATEYMAECSRSTDVWKTWPRRMLRHKSMIQCARYAFGFAGIVDPDEYERQVEQPRLAAPAGLSQRLIASTSEGFNAVVDSETGEVIDPLDRDGIPAEFTGEIDRPSPEPQSQADDFPGDKPAATKTGPTLPERVEAFKGRCLEAKTTLKLKSIHAASSALRSDLDASDPEEAVALDDWFNARFEEVQAAEDEARRQQ